VNQSKLLFKKFIFMVLETESKVLYLLGKCFSPELCPSQPALLLSILTIIFIILGYQWLR
jgi:hypothetical protein